MCSCQRVFEEQISFTRLHSGTSPTTARGRSVGASPVRRVDPCSAIGVSLPGVWDLTAPSPWVGILREVAEGRRGKEMGGRKREEEGGPLYLSLSCQQALFSPRSPGLHTPAGTLLIMRPVWRRGQSEAERKVLCDRLCTWEILVYDCVTSQGRLHAVHIQFTQTTHVQTFIATVEQVIV